MIARLTLFLFLGLVASLIFFFASETVEANAYGNGTRSVLLFVFLSFIFLRRGRRRSESARVRATAPWAVAVACTVLVGAFGLATGRGITNSILDAVFNCAFLGFVIEGVAMARVKLASRIAGS